MKLYMHPVSTTCRMVTLFAAEEGIALDYQLIDLMQGQQRQPEYLKVNPNGLIPTLVDEGFTLPESGAILRYLATKYKSSAYPADIQERARVDAAMEWFYSNFYKDMGYNLVYPQLLPHHQRSPEQAQAGTVAWGKEKAMHWLSILDQQMLGPDNKFVCGGSITLADYVGAEMVGLGDLIHCEFAAYPNVRRWMDTMKSLPNWNQTHEAFDGFAASTLGQSFVAI